MVRLQKFLAESGVASRRASEQVILEGRVSVNGEAVRVLGTKVDPANDRVTVDGRPVGTRTTRTKLYVALNKPAGYICSRHDPEKRRTVGDLLPREWTRLYPVGRLDYNTEGLLFLTNDGEFCLRLTHPRFGVPKIYRVTLEGRVGPELAGRLVRGVEHEGERLRASKARLVSTSNSHSEIELELTEGRNREVRRIFETLGLKITQLRRTQIGRIKLGELPPGKWRVLTPPEVRSLILNAGDGPGVRIQGH